MNIKTILLMLVLTISLAACGSPRIPKDSDLMQVVNMNEYLDYFHTCVNTAADLQERIMSTDRNNKLDYLVRTCRKAGVVHATFSSTRGELRNHPNWIELCDMGYRSCPL